MLRDRPITNIMRHVPILSPDDSLSKAVSEMGSAQVQALPVISDGRIAGAVTEQTVLQHLADNAEAKVAQALDVNPSSISVYMKISEAAEVMAKTREHTLLVVDELGSYRGVVTRSDLLSTEFSVIRPPSIAGMATPIGVHLTTGATSAGAGSLGLYLTGITMMLILVAARSIMIGAAMAVDGVFDTHILTLLESQPVGSGTVGGLRVDSFHYIIATVQVGLVLLLLRLSPLSGYHAAEHMVVHTIEAGKPLTPESVLQMPRAHPRCGTNLMAGATIFIAIISYLGTNVGPTIGLLVGIVIVLIGWRTIGYYMQQYITTRPPKPWQLEAGIRTGEQLLEQYQTHPSRHADGFGRIWSMGLIQVIAGFATISWVAHLIQKMYPGVASAIFPF